MSLYYDNLSNKWKEFVMPVETTSEPLDLRPFVDQTVIANAKRMLVEHENPSPEMVEEFCFMFENAGYFTRMRMYMLLVKNTQEKARNAQGNVNPNLWLFQVHQKVGMLMVETSKGNVPMTDAEKAVYESYSTRLDCGARKVIWSDES